MIAKCKYRYFPNSEQVWKEAWRDENGDHHRDGDLPAYSEYDMDGRVSKYIWMKNGGIHRENGPAELVWYTNSKTGFRWLYYQVWCINDWQHRDDGPAYITYYSNGNVHTKEWFKHGSCHRLDGPAWIIYNDDGNVDRSMWYIDGDVVDINELKDYIALSEEDKIVLKLLT